MAAKAEAAGAETELDGEEGAPAKRKLPIKLIAIGAAGFLLVAGGGTTAYKMFSGKKHQEEKAATPVAMPVAFLDLPDVMVNLSSPGSDRAHYLKLKIALEVADQAIVPQIQPLLPRVMDAFQTYLRELRPMDLEGSAGLYRLKEELTRRVNAAIEPARINAVLFKEILVQ